MMMLIHVLDPSADQSCIEAGLIDAERCMAARQSVVATDESRQNPPGQNPPDVGKHLETWAGESFLEGILSYLWPLEGDSVLGDFVRGDSVRGRCEPIHNNHPDKILPSRCRQTFRKGGFCPADFVQGDFVRGHCGRIQK